MTEFWKWQPIETAPRDGCVLLMAEDGPVTGLKARHVFSAYWSPDERYFNGGCWKSPVSSQLVFLPTHWMPLPEPPND